MIRPARGVCLVRRATTEETIPGGKIFLPEDTRRKMAAYQVEVLAVGEPEFCDNEHCARVHQWRNSAAWTWQPTEGFDRVHAPDLNLQPGSWAIVRPRSFIQASADDHGLYFVKTSDVFAVLAVAEGTPKD